MKEILFVSGVARSGTSALVSTLNLHPDFLVGMERYFFIIKRGDIAPSYFERDRFVDVRDGDTHGKGLSGTIEQRVQRFERARFVGDKFPLLFEHFDYIFERFPRAAHIYIVRNPLSVIESYDARFKDTQDRWRKKFQLGLNEWNNSIQKVVSLSPERISRFQFLIYEDYFNSVKCMNDLFDRMGSQRLPDDKLRHVVTKYKSLSETPVARRDDIRMYVARNADWESYSKLCKLIEERNKG